MNRQELFNEVKSWLEAEKLAFTADDEATFRLQINADNCLFQVRLQCEDEPPLLQVICTLPMKVPPEKVSEAGLVVHNINVGLRLGGFQFHVAERVVTFRMALPICTEADLVGQFAQSMGAALSTADAQVRTLGLLACSGEEAQQALAKLSPTPDAGEVNLRRAGGRLELN